MQRNQRLSRCALGLLGLFAVLPAHARAQDPILIQFSHVAAPDTVKGRAAQRFKELAEQRTGGRVKVEVYPNSQLYKDREELEALQLGAVQMLATSLSKLAGLVRDFDVFGLPFLFKDDAAFRGVADGPVGTALFAKLAAKGLSGLAYWSNGFEILSAHRPLHTVADFRGLRMRIQSSRVLVAQMKALGASPRVTQFADQYAAFKSGELDGGENVPSNFDTQRLDDVQEHLTVSHHAYLAYAVLVNRTFWDGLPEDIRSTLRAALQEASALSNQLAARDNARALQQIAQRGKTTVYRLAPDEALNWRRALRGVHKLAEAWISRETLTAVHAAVGYSERDEP
jgi:C4-dicarboxylate-binding protein DctP